MKNLLVILTCGLGLTACASPALVAIPMVVGTGLAINNENLEQPLTEPKEIAVAIVDGVKDGYSRETFEGFELNE